jgi:hypothetical protein
MSTDIAGPERDQRDMKSFEPRVVCTKCGTIGTDVRPLPPPGGEDTYREVSVETSTLFRRGNVLGAAISYVKGRRD